MSWAKYAKEELAKGNTTQIRPRGHSMRPKVCDGNLVTLEPVGERKLRKGDIVLVTVRGRDYLHLIKGVGADTYQIGNNKGGTNGWVHPRHIHGICVRVES